MSLIFIAVDPGLQKSGLAVMDFQGHIKEREIVPTSRLCARVTYLKKKYPELERLALGAGTGHKRILSMLRDFLGETIEIHLVEERHTTELAREKYFEKHPPRGLKRLLPRGLRVPSRPVDDYAAVIIGERFIETRKGTDT